MTEQSGGGGSSSLWLGVALVFVGMLSKDLFTNSSYEGSSGDTEKPSSQMEELGNRISFQYCYS